MLKSLKTTKLIFAIILATFLVSCATDPMGGKDQVKMGYVSLKKADKQPEFYLNKIKQNQSPELQNRYMLLAADSYLNKGDYLGAENVLKTLKPTLTRAPQIRAQYLYLLATSLAMQNKNAEALELLNYPKKWKLENWQWIAYYQLKGKLYKSLHKPIEYIEQLSEQSQYIPLNERSEINQQIWKELKPIPADTIKQYTDGKHEAIFSGWMQLAYIVKHYAVSPNELIRYLGQWQRQHPTHPAALELPVDLENALNTKPFQPQIAAILLPMTGSKSTLANPIEQGLLSSYIDGDTKKITVKFYDTSADSVAAYKQAINDGAEFIIGPLLQSNVTKVINYQNENPNEDGSVTPQLFLNQSDHFTPSKDQFYFSLSPQEEASDAAHKLFKDDIKMPLLLVSSDLTGRRMAESFRKTWLELTNKDAEVHYYQNGDKMKFAVQQAMGVKDSKERINHIKTLLNPDIKADFRSRRDIDAIYMIAGPRDLTLLKPFIDVNFSVFTKPVPLYTSSRSRLAKSTNKTALELNNITISDIPWLMEPSSDNKRIADLWPSWNNGQKRLFAMGYDAYELIGRLAQMRAFTGYQFSGRSGQLVVKNDGVINRHLSWGKYKQGQLVPLN